MSDLLMLLRALGFTDAERAGFHCIDPRNGSASCYTANVPDIPDTEDYGPKHWYFNICPTNCARLHARGNKSEVTRLSSVFIDLDDKVTADPLAALEVVCGALGELPTAVVRSGGGWQPYWAVADGHITDTFTTEDADALLKAWGRFVNQITGLSFDPTWELAREFRIPGSKNFKSDPPRPVTVEFFDSPRLTLSALATTLTGHGISIGAPLPRERVTTARDWRFSIFDCPWAVKAVTGWKTDCPRSSAHTGILGKLVKRECMKRHGCLSRRTYDSTDGLLRNWMENNASYYQGRNFDREFDGALSKAADLVDHMTTDEVVDYTYTPTQVQRQTATTDTFTVTASNGVHTATETVSVPIDAGTPVAGTPTVGSPNSSTGAVTGSAVFTDPAGRTLTYSAPTTSTGGGTVTVNTSTGAYTYTPTQAQRQTATATTTDTFTVTASNGVHNATETVTVPVDVGTPVAGTATVGSPNSSTGAVSGTAVFTDPAGRTLTYSAPATSTGGGTVTINASTGAYTYTPTTAQREVATTAATDTFTVTTSNGVHTTTETVTVPISPPPWSHPSLPPTLFPRMGS